MVAEGDILGPLHSLEKRLDHVLTVDFYEYMRKWIPLSIVIGIVGSLFSVAFQLLIDVIWTSAYGDPLPWFVIFLVPALGGLVAGAVLTFFPEGQGFGTDGVIESIHHKGGAIKWYLVPTKLVASAITLGSGGSAGREGPSALIGAGLASTLGSRLKLRRSDMRVFLIAGTAACFSALFKAPLGCAVFAMEVPYKNDLESNAIIPSLISSVIAFLVAVPIFGLGPYMDVEEVGFAFDSQALVFVLLVGVLTGGMGVLFILGFRRFRRLVAGIELPFFAKVTLGGLLTGIIGLSVPEVLGLSEETIESLINGHMVAIELLLALLVGKLTATVFTVGSGGSGGIFFPSLFMGGVVGALIANLFELSNPGLYVVVGMGAMMAGVTKTPVSAPIMITEMVGGYGVIIPVMIASALAYVITGDYTLYEKQITRRAFPLDVSTLGMVRVVDIMKRPVLTIRRTATIADAMEVVRSERHYTYPVVDSGDRILGQAPRERIEHLYAASPDVSIMEALQTHFDKVPSDMEGLDAFELMNVNQVSRVMVVDPVDQERLVGILTRMDVLRAMEHLDEYHHQY